MHGTYQQKKSRFLCFCFKFLQANKDDETMHSKYTYKLKERKEIKSKKKKTYCANKFIKNLGVSVSGRSGGLRT
jgi:hypothetical protein